MAGANRARLDAALFGAMRPQAQIDPFAGLDAPASQGRWTPAQWRGPARGRDQARMERYLAGEGDPAVDRAATLPQAVPLQDPMPAWRDDLPVRRPPPNRDGMVPLDPFLETWVPDPNAPQGDVVQTTRGRVGALDPGSMANFDDFGDWHQAQRTPFDGVGGPDLAPWRDPATGEAAPQWGLEPPDADVDASPAPFSNDDPAWGRARRRGEALAHDEQREMLATLPRPGNPAVAQLKPRQRGRQNMPRFGEAQPSQDVSANPFRAVPQEDLLLASPATRALRGEIPRPTQQDEEDLAALERMRAEEEWSPLPDEAGWLNPPIALARNSWEALQDLPSVPNLLTGQGPVLRDGAMERWRDRGEYFERAGPQIGAWAEQGGAWLDENLLSGLTLGEMMGADERRRAEQQRRERGEDVFMEARDPLYGGHAPDIVIEAEGPGPLRRAGAMAADFWQEPSRWGREARGAYVEADRRVDLARAQGDGEGAQQWEEAARQSAGADALLTGSGALEFIPGIGLIDLGVAGARFTGRQGARALGMNVPDVLAAPARELPGPLTREAQRSRDAVVFGGGGGWMLGDAVDGEMGEDDPIVPAMTGALGYAALRDLPTVARRARAIAGDDAVLQAQRVGEDAPMGFEGGPQALRDPLDVEAQPAPQRRFQAAVRDPETGEVYTGADHWDAINTAPDDVRPRLEQVYSASAEDPQSVGFMVDGQFMSREDGMAALRQPRDPLAGIPRLDDGRVRLQTPQERRAWAGRALAHDVNEAGEHLYGFNADNGARMMVTVQNAPESPGTAIVSFRDDAQPRAGLIDDGYAFTGGRTQGAALQTLERVVAAVQQHAATEAPDRILIQPATEAHWNVYRRLAATDPGTGQARMAPIPGYTIRVDNEALQLVLERNGEALPNPAHLAEVGDSEMPATLRGMPILAAPLAAGALTYADDANADDGGEGDWGDLTLPLLTTAGVGGFAALMARGRGRARGAPAALERADDVIRGLDVDLPTRAPDAGRRGAPRLPEWIVRNPSEADLARIAELGDEMKYVMDMDGNVYAFSAADGHHNTAMRALRDSGVTVRPLGAGAEVTDPDAAGFIWRNQDGTFSHENANMVQSGPFSAFQQRVRPSSTLPDEGRAGARSFTTSRGSTYEVHEDGTTTRNKAARSDPGHEGQRGPQPRSQRTIYVTEEVANALATPQGSWRVYISGDTVSLLTPGQGGRWGISPSQRNLAFETAPREGLTPIEVWNPDDGASGAFRKVHFGNPIVRVADGPNGGPSAPRTDDTIQGLAIGGVGGGATGAIMFGEDAEAGDGAFDADGIPLLPILGGAGIGALLLGRGNRSVVGANGARPARELTGEANLTAGARGADEARTTGQRTLTARQRVLLTPDQSYILERRLAGLRPEAIADEMGLPVTSNSVSVQTNRAMARLAAGGESLALPSVRGRQADGLTDKVAALREQGFSRDVIMERLGIDEGTLASREQMILKRRLDRRPPAPISLRAEADRLVSEGVVGQAELREALARRASEAGMKPTTQSLTTIANVARRRAGLTRGAGGRPADALALAGLSLGALALGSSEAEAEDGVELQGLDFTGAQPIPDSRDTIALEDGTLRHRDYIELANGRVVVRVMEQDPRTLAFSAPRFYEQDFDIPGAPTQQLGEGQGRVITEGVRETRLPPVIEGEDGPVENQGGLPWWARGTAALAAGLGARSALGRAGVRGVTREVPAAATTFGTSMLLDGEADEALATAAATPFVGHLGGAVARRTLAALEEDAAALAARNIDERALTADPAFQARARAFAQTLSDAPVRARVMRGDNFHGDIPRENGRTWSVAGDEVAEQGYYGNAPIADGVLSARSEFLDASPGEQLVWMDRVGFEAAADPGRIALGRQAIDALPPAPLAPAIDEAALQGLPAMPRRFRTPLENTTARTIQQRAGTRPGKATLESFAGRYGIERGRNARETAENIRQAGLRDARVRAAMRDWGLAALLLGVGVAAPEDAYARAAGLP